MRQCPQRHKWPRPPAQSAREQQELRPERNMANIMGNIRGQHAAPSLTAASAYLGYTSDALEQSPDIGCLRKPFKAVQP